MNNTPVEMIVAAFPTPDGAGKGMQELQRIKKEGLIGIEDMAIIVKDAQGKTKITNSKHRSAKGFLTGGVVGGLIALLAGPAGWGVAAGGGVIGALAGRIRNLPIKGALKDLSESLVPNSSAIIAVIEHTWVNDCERALAAAGARVVHDELKADIAAQLEAGGNVLYSALATETGVSAGRAAQSPQGTSVSGVTSTGTGTGTSGGRIAATPEGVFVEQAMLTDEKLVGGAAVATESGAVGVRGKVKV
jgi:uncharacterized membrane protein